MIASRALHYLVVASTLTGACLAEKLNEIRIMDGHKVKNDHFSPLPHTYVDAEALPDSFDWGDVDGVSYLTRSLNQHLPQYCGSCWAHGSLSALADRIKIHRKAKGEDINLSIQFILNCGTDVAGSCHGGYHSGTYELIKQKGFVPYETCMPYVACSKESKEGFCAHVDTTCSDFNTCRTCSTFSHNGGKCAEITPFPHATVKEYGVISGADVIMAEIYARGPVAAEINAEPILQYDGTIFTDQSAKKSPNHIVSITGWGVDKSTGKKYWNVRNSWGEYWGNLGFAKVEMGHNLLGLESAVAWATPGEYTVSNTACAEDGNNCSSGKKYVSEMYVDPSNDIESVQRRLGML